MFDGRWRNAVDRTTKPVGSTLVRIGVTADVLTVFGLAMAVVTAFVVGSGHLDWGIAMLFATGLPDLFDGPVAKAAGRASVRGAYFDSVADRIADALLLGGVAWYLSAHHHGEMVLLPLAIVAVTSLISYQRAKAELLGLSATGGLMERAERFILLGLCFIAGTISTAAFVPALWVFLGLVSATAVGRFVSVWKAAEGPPPAERPAWVRAAGSALATGVVARDGAETLAHHDGTRRSSARRRQAHVDSRWRTWREARAQRDMLGARAASPRRAGTPSERWRARRAGAPSSRSGRIWRDRRAARPTSRVARRPSSRGA